MRGKLNFVGVIIVFRRITPADAGKTGTVIPLSAVIKDHPRGCGENARTHGGML